MVRSYFCLKNKSKIINDDDDFFIIKIMTVIIKYTFMQQQKKKIVLILFYKELYPTFLLLYKLNIYMSYQIYSLIN